MTRSIIYRIVLSLLVGACIAFASDTPKGSISDTLFTVLGIVYSIVMSLLITFSTSGIKNAEYRKVIKKLINKKISLTTVDFFIPVLFYLSIYIERLPSGFVGPIHCFIGAIVVSLVSLTRVFFYIRKLNDDIEEKIFEEQKQNL